MTDLLLPNVNKAKHFRHGYKTAGKYSPEYSIWTNMRSRCYNPKNTRHASYGARGITVCDEWQADFLNFLNDMGRRPSPAHSLEREDNDGNYEPGNCRWATRQEQARNRRTSRFLVVDGESKTMAEWSEISGVGVSTIFARLKSGWDEKKAILTPSRALVSKSGKEHKTALIHKTLPF